MKMPSNFAPRWHVIVMHSLLLLMFLAGGVIADPALEYKS